MRNIVYRLFIVLFLTFSFAQVKPGNGIRMGGSITGEVKDKLTSSPVEYCNIVLFNNNDELITGTITTTDGKFKLEKIKPGNYYIEIKFMGYKTKLIEDLTISRNSRILDIGSVNLKRLDIELENVEVVAEKQKIEFKIDKKVINVDQQSTETSGTAVDILQNTPSVTVDIEGNVSLRGSTNFTVLIDGKPTVLDPSEALEQLPATTIENIEIITNPSAKYNPEGTSGIINIVLKKNKVEGYSGIVNGNLGLNEKYGADFLLNYRNSNYSWFIGADYNDRKYPGEMKSVSETTVNGIKTIVNNDADRTRSGYRYGLQGGFNYNLSDNDYAGISFRYGGRERKGSSNSLITETNTSTNLISKYFDNGTGTREGTYYRINFDYSHKFNNKGHELTLQAARSNRDFDEYDENYLKDENQVIYEAHKYTEKGPSDGTDVKLDYVLPFSENLKIEAGYKLESDKSEETNENFKYDISSGDFVFQDEYSYSTNYERNIHAFYGIYNGKSGAFGYQAGVRGEYTDRVINIVDINDKYTIDRWDIFPTFHFSYEFEKKTQVMASYTKRIVRPRGWYLEPFETWRDAYNVRKGNPGLEPEDIDSYEIGFNSFFNWGAFSIEAYYRYTTNVIERVRSVFAENIMLHTYANAGNSKALGTEIMFNFDPVEWWSVNLMSDLYNFKQEGEVFGQKFIAESFNYGIRFNNDIKLSELLKFQLNTIYNGPSEYSQGEREGFFMVNSALRFEIIKNKFTATLQARDIFGTFKHKSSSYGPDFYNSFEFSREAPIVMLNLSFKINNYKQKRNRGGNNGMDEGMED